MTITNLVYYPERNYSDGSKESEKVGFTKKLKNSKTADYCVDVNYFIYLPDSESEAYWNLELTMEEELCLLRFIRRKRKRLYSTKEVKTLTWWNELKRPRIDKCLFAGDVLDDSLVEELLGCSISVDDIADMDSVELAKWRHETRHLLAKRLSNGVWEVTGWVGSVDVAFEPRLDELIDDIAYEIRSKKTSVYWSELNSAYELYRYCPKDAEVGLEV